MHQYLDQIRNFSHTILVMIVFFRLHSIERQLGLVERHFRLLKKPRN